MRWLGKSWEPTKSVSTLIYVGIKILPQPCCRGQWLSGQVVTTYAWFKDALNTRPPSSPREKLRNLSHMPQSKKTQFPGKPLELRKQQETGLKTGFETGFAATWRGIKLFFSSFFQSFPSKEKYFTCWFKKIARIFWAAINYLKICIVTFLCILLLVMKYWCLIHCS